ncbi:odorant receptor 131-2-like [Triplophysa rosa]|uniref:Growth hormone secretagogue receptor type 1-like n=1 Tax=Triplophysa rosa TaxID=992332 RepID=A0A9W7TNT2_TRIRA|nr:odorant receptor 131-2-like [Triplophysa rosa]KAI7800570.1 putative growth hormone secretagogue receptor type 1-like [Triplophysa rosa]
MAIQNASEAEQMHLIQVDPVRRNISLALTQIFVWPFIYLIFFMLLTFSRKEAFRTDTRYILFGHSLLVDLMFLLLTDLVVILSYNVVLIPLHFCVPVCMLIDTITACAPLTIMAMCLERYVAICMPLRHNAISTSRRALMVILMIWILSFISPFVDMLILVSTASREYLSQKTHCHYEIMIPEGIRRFGRGLLFIVRMLIILIVEVICYVMIFLAARAASSDKKSASKGQRTISLHIIQLFLCSVEIVCPYIENVVMQYDIQTYLTVRFVNFLVFSITSRAVSPLVYGFRDEKFYAAMVYYLGCKINVISSDTDR